MLLSVIYILVISYWYKNKGQIILIVCELIGCDYYVKCLFAVKKKSKMFILYLKYNLYVILNVTSVFGYVIYHKYDLIIYMFFECSNNISDILVRNHIQVYSLLHTHYLHQTKLIYN